MSSRNSGIGRKGKIYAVDSLPSCSWDELATPPIVRKQPTSAVSSLANSPYWKKLPNGGASGSAYYPPLKPAAVTTVAADKKGDRRKSKKPISSSGSPRSHLDHVSPVKRPAVSPSQALNLDIDIGDLNSTTSPEEILLDCGISISPRALRASDSKRRKNLQLYEERTLELRLGSKERRIRGLCGDRQWVKEWDAACAIQRAVRCTYAVRELARLKKVRDTAAGVENYKKSVRANREAERKRLHARHEQALTEYDRRHAAGLVIQRVARGYTARHRTMQKLISDHRTQTFVKQSMASTVIAAYMRAKISSGVVAGVLRDRLVEAYYVFNTSAVTIQRHWRGTHDRKRASTAAVTVQNFWRTRVEMRKYKHAKNQKKTSFLKYKNDQILLEKYYERLQGYIIARDEYRALRKEALEARSDVLYINTCRRLAGKMFGKLYRHRQISLTNRLRGVNRLKTVRRYYEKMAMRVAKWCTAGRLRAKNEKKVLKKFMLRLNEWCMAAKLERKNGHLLAERYYKTLVGYKKGARCDTLTTFMTEILSEDESTGYFEELEPSQHALYPALQTLLSLSDNPSQLTSLELAVSTPPEEDLSAVSLTNLEFVETLLAAASVQGAHYPLLEMYKAYLETSEQGGEALTTPPPSPPQWTLDEEHAGAVIQTAWRTHRRGKVAHATGAIQRAWRSYKSRARVEDLRAKRLGEYDALRQQGAAYVLQPVGRGALTRLSLSHTWFRMLETKIIKLTEYHEQRVRRGYWLRWAEYSKAREAGFESQNSTVLHSARSYHEAAASHHTATHLRTLRHLRYLHEVALQREAENDA
eukprot:TRINITY_DN7019_c0_g2_i1.p1 TRINITY_DN7019_c0_g2~~TRINITY_DN7019_c0_g2_i1.p1  ORF type:complete len:815 (+),score=149.73 TRINITY_DN7019_c0_g2_i1:922-3366(+)